MYWPTICSCIFKISRITYRVKRQWVLLGMGAVMMSWALPVNALDNIRDEFWGLSSGVIPPIGRRVGVTFDADMTTADVSALTFAVIDIHSQQNLIEFSANLTPLPPAGTPVTLTFGFRVRCTSGGQLEAQAVSIYVTFCDPTSGATNYYDPNINGPWVGVAGSGGSFRLAIVDQNGSPGSSPGNTMECGSADAIMEESDDWFSQLKEQKQEQLNRIAQDGDSGTIGIYFDEAATICGGTILPNSPTLVYVIARLDGITNCGMTGGEFRFSGVPASWQVFPVANPDMVALGNPFLDGVSFAMTSCQQPENGLVILYRVLVMPSGVESDVEFKVLPRTVPSNPWFQCSQLLVCDAPFFGKVCVDGISCHVNPTQPKACQVAVAVEGAEWGSIKGLYR